MKRTIILLVLLTLGTMVKAQQPDKQKKGTGKEISADSLMNSLDSTSKQSNAVAVFKASRLILSPTTETVKKNNLNFLVIHRFGDISSGAGGGKTFYGLDRVQDVYIGFEYGVTDNLNISLGRNTINQLIELGLKYAILHQTSDNSSPIAITVLGDAGMMPHNDFSTTNNSFSYIAQAIFSRKFTSALSLQVSPIFISNDTAIPDLPGNEQQFFAVSAAGRLRVTKAMSIVVDYEHPFSTFRQNSANGFHDPLGFGIEAQTGGHVFTLNITNANAISEINYVNRSQMSYGSGQYRLGFTISRMFDFNHKSNKKW
jgi:Membrane bound beta barrel domain (DUF5777)